MLDSQPDTSTTSGTQPVAQAQATAQAQQAFFEGAGFPETMMSDMRGGHPMRW